MSGFQPTRVACSAEPSSPCDISYRQGETKQSMHIDTRIIMGVIIGFESGLVKVSESFQQAYRARQDVTNPTECRFLQWFF